MPNTIVPVTLHTENKNTSATNPEVLPSTPTYYNAEIPFTMK